MNFKKITLTVFSLAAMTLSPLVSTRSVLASERPRLVAALSSIPLKGSLSGNDTDLGFTDTTVTVQTAGTGKATLLGRFSFTQVVTVDLNNGTNAGVAHWVAANGDSIDLSVAGFGVPRMTPDGLVFDITETDTIIGGTGRFANAQGSFIVQRVASPDTFQNSGSFQGNLNY